MNSMRARLLAVATLVALALVAAPNAGAGKGYSDASLSGAYHFTMVEVTITDDVPSRTIYCSGYGRIVFDGAGAAEVEDGIGRCFEAGVPVDISPYTETFTYSVDPDGEVYMQDSGESWTHCQLADKGAMLLCDGTGGTYGAPSERALWMVTASKL